MPLVSMTGFGRAESTLEFDDGRASIQVEARCVNGRGAEIKVRLPSGFEGLERSVREELGKIIKRGNANISVQLRQKRQLKQTINLEALKALREQLVGVAAEWGQSEPTLADLLSAPGVFDASSELTDNAAQTEALKNAITALVSETAASLSGMRREEGSALEATLSGILDQISNVSNHLAELPAAKGHHLMPRLREQVAELVSEQDGLDEARLHQEVALLVTKGDIEEEISRLRVHVDAAHALMQQAQSVGRKLDFLAQEMNREANTICSKASDITITQHGLELKALIDQFKEQVQNVE